MQTNNKCREACEMFVAAMDYHKCVHETMLAEAYQKAKAAIAEPIRNCDVGTAEEQTDRYVAFCNSYTRCADCPCDKIDGDCELTWSQMPYEEGGAE